MTGNRRSYDLEYHRITVQRHAMTCLVPREGSNKDLFVKLDIAAELGMNVSSAFGSRRDASPGDARRGSAGLDH